ncbi:protein takeout-like [Periplaneta americana]|uniref:protein takeout-like n=1 Tax=Periplaneta americana TaxID=6978 RepID=UPI0037E7ECC2
MMRVSAIIVVLVAAACKGTLPVPPYFNVCARSDPGFNDCALKNAKVAVPSLVKGDRKYDIPVLDPFEMKELKISGGPNQAGISISMKDVKLYGLEGSNLQAVPFDFDKKQLLIHNRVPRMEMVGKYEMSGRILVLPITGKGDFNFTLVDNDIKYYCDFKLVEKDGNTFLEVTDSRTELQPSDLKINLENLFNGDRLLGPQTNMFLNENWQEVFKELSPAFTEAFSQIFKLIINNVASNVLYNDLFPEKLPK